MSPRPRRPALAAPLVLILCAVCGGPPPEAVESNAPPAGTTLDYARLPDAEMQRLVDSVDYIDYLFYEFEFSMSLDEDKGIKYAIAQIGEDPATPRATCRPIGRVFYQISGRTAAEADLYFSPGCTYLTFLDDAGGVAYANAMSAVGKDFFNNQFAQLIDDYQPVR